MVGQASQKGLVLPRRLLMSVVSLDQAVPNDLFKKNRNF